MPKTRSILTRTHQQALVKSAFFDRENALARGPAAQSFLNIMAVLLGYRMVAAGAAPVRHGENFAPGWVQQAGQFLLPRQ